MTKSLSELEIRFGEVLSKWEAEMVKANRADLVKHDLLSRWWFKALPRNIKAWARST